MISQRNIITTQHFVSIEFDVIGMITAKNKKQCRNRVKTITMEMATILGLHESLFEVIRPAPIKKGLMVHINIYINYTKEIDMNIERDINEAQKKGEISEIIKKAWKLSTYPTISNIKYIRQESQERTNTLVFGRTISTISQMKKKVNDENVSEIVMTPVGVISEDNNDNDGSIEDISAEVLVANTSPSM